MILETAGDDFFFFHVSFVFFFSRALPRLCNVFDFCYDSMFNVNALTLTSNHEIRGK